MSFLTKATSHVRHVAVDKVERYGASAVFGFLKGSGKRYLYKNIPMDAGVGGLLTLLGAYLQIKSHGRSAIAPHLNAVGDAGVMSYFNSMGAAWGAKKSGRKVYVLEAGAKAPAGLKPVDVMGEIPQMVSGAFLSADEIANFAGQR